MYYKKKSEIFVTLLTVQEVLSCVQPHYQLQSLNYPLLMTVKTQQAAQVLRKQLLESKKKRRNCQLPKSRFRISFLQNKSSLPVSCLWKQEPVKVLNDTKLTLNVRKFKQYIYYFNFLTYSEVPNRRACSIRFFRFSFHPARNFSCNKQKIPLCSFINLLSK